MPTDFITNNTASGTVAEKLLASNFSPNALRPYIGLDGASYITVNKKGDTPVALRTNAVATLRKDEWIEIDKVVVKAGMARLKAVKDLQARGLVHNLRNGMGTTIFQSQTMSNADPASVTMDGVERADEDRQLFKLDNLPIPIIHKDFSFSAREIQQSRNGGQALDLSLAESAAMQVATSAEQLLIGNSTIPFNFGGGHVYGYTNFPNRITATIQNPTSSTWLPNKTITDVLGMLQSSANAFHYGPFALYYGPAWSRYMNGDYKDNGDATLRDRLARIDSITNVTQLDHLTGYDLVVVQMTSDVVREIIAMQMTTLQWATEGGLKQNYKVMAILVPQLRADYNGNTGIVHGTVA